MDQFYREEVMSQLSSLDRGQSSTHSRSALVQSLRRPFLKCAAFDPKDCVKRSARYLVEHMPKKDLHRLSPAFLAKNVAFALIARKRFAWSSGIPWALFLNEVLPYAVLTERRDDWRKLFFIRMGDCVEGVSSAKAAAVAMNKCAWEIVQPPIVFVAAPPNELNQYSPLEVLRAHNASCTGLSVFLVDALRSVGIPARVAGVPHWNKGPKVCPHADNDPPCGNHDWVEVWVEGSWHFIDQRGNSPGLDKSWFYPALTDLQVPLSGNHSVYATSWADPRTLDPKYYPENIAVKVFPMVWQKEQTVPGWDVANWYHHKPRSFFSVFFR